MKNQRTLYNCLTDISDYVTRDDQRIATEGLASYWMRERHTPLLLVGLDWGGGQETEHVATVLRNRGLVEGRDFVRFPTLSVTAYLGDLDDDIGRIMEGEAGRPVEGGEYRIIRPCQRSLMESSGPTRFGEVVFVEDWGMSYTASFGALKWAADAAVDGHLATDMIGLLMVKDFRGAAPYAIVRQRHDDGKRYRSLPDMLKERAPKLSRYLDERGVLGSISPRPKKDPSIRLEHAKRKATVLSRKRIDPLIAEAGHEITCSDAAINHVLEDVRNVGVSG